MEGQVVARRNSALRLLQFPCSHRDLDSLSVAGALFQVGEPLSHAGGPRAAESVRRLR